MNLNVKWTKIYDTYAKWMKLNAKYMNVNVKSTNVNAKINESKC
jgi:hypothetical protein